MMRIRPYARVGAGFYTSIQTVSDAENEGYFGIKSGLGVYVSSLYRRTFGLQMAVFQL